jgi:hypothetical protein
MNKKESWRVRIANMKERSKIMNKEDELKEEE